MKQEIINWITQGCDLQTGIKLYAKYAFNDHFLRILKLNPEGNRSMLEYQLCKIAGISENDFKKLKRKSHGKNTQKKSEPKPVNKRNRPGNKKKVNKSPKLRDEFSFLNEPECPPEFKILISDKITAYHNYVHGHKKLFDCTTNAQQYETGLEILINYRENKLIYEELDYYATNKKILGKHPIFSHLKNVQKLKGMNILDLVKKNERLEHNIWRIESEIKKGNKPHLDQERKEKLKYKQAELGEIKRLLNIG
jgi:hypothetical protein